MDKVGFPSGEYPLNSVPMLGVASKCEYTRRLAGVTEEEVDEVWALVSRVMFPTADLIVSNGDWMVVATGMIVEFTSTLPL